MKSGDILIYLISQSFQTAYIKENGLREHKMSFFVLKIHFERFHQKSLATEI